MSQHCIFPPAAAWLRLKAGKDQFIPHASFPNTFLSTSSLLRFLLMELSFSSEIADYRQI